MELTDNQISHTLNRFPSIELSYETITHKKVPQNYSLCLAIPPGRKALIWFTFFQDEDVCFLLEANREKKISKMKRISEPDTIPNKLAHGTILYGTILETSDMFFLIEDVFMYEGVSSKKLPFGEKLGILENMFHKYRTPLMTNLTMKIVLPLMWKTLNKEPDTYIPERLINEMPYGIHHLQYRTLNTISPYLNVLFTRKFAKDEMEEKASFLNIPPPCPIYDFSKPQYKYPTLFEVKADLQFDIYHLYAFGRNCKKEYYGIAYIPNYKTSVFMNAIFRKIKENKNLDYIEESDDEEDFQDTRIDKYVNLKKTAVVECVFHTKFKRWVPLKQIMGNVNGRIVHVGKLVK